MSGRRRRPTIGDGLTDEVRRKLRKWGDFFRSIENELDIRGNATKRSSQKQVSTTVSNEAALDEDRPLGMNHGRTGKRPLRKGRRSPTLPPKVRKPVEPAIPEVRWVTIKQEPRPPQRYDYVGGRYELVRHLSDMDPAAFDAIRGTPPGQTFDVAQAAQLGSRLELGRGLAFPTPPASQTSVRVILGFDFGTSSSKIVIRSPELPRPNAIAVPALPFARYDQHPFLWASHIWLGHDGELALTPAAGRKRVSGIKAGLMTERAASLALATSGGRMLTPLAAAIGFLALMIRQARGWFYAVHSQQFNRGPLIWSLNLGFPAATLSDPRLRRHYRAIAAAAWALAGQDKVPTIRCCEAAAQKAAGQDSLPTGLDRLHIVPEITAATMGFLHSFRRENGLFALVDVGATTLDVSTFTIYSDRDEQDGINVWLADVERFGVRPWHVCCTDPTWKDRFEAQADFLLRNLLFETRRRRDPNNAVWKPGGELRVLCTGGGITASIYQRLLRSLDAWMKRPCPESRGVRLCNLDIFADVGLGESPDADPGRLLVATGLSWPSIDFPVMTVPSEIDDIDPPPIRDISTVFVDKSQA